MHYLSYVSNNDDLFFSAFTLQKLTALIHTTNSGWNTIGKKFIPS